jgi:hypothetical protein
MFNAMPVPPAELAVTFLEYCVLDNIDVIVNDIIDG